MSWLWPQARFDKLARKHVIIHMREEHSLDGVLTGLYADGVQLDAARYLHTDGDSTPLEGAQIVPWASIVWIQELSDAGPLVADA